MLRDDLEQLIDGRLSRRGVQAVLRAADMLRQVQRVLGHPLPEVVREAITALNLDIDMLLARHMRADHAEATLDASHVALAKSPIDAVMNSSTRICRRSHRKACRVCARSSHGWIRCATLPKRTRWPPMCRRRGVDDRAPVEGA